ncbi:DUF6765 family protein [Desulfoluna butyratoxydans]|uniref:Uncharacterized protein n=1 Tax=Desulfoluna butyratoxydans TaxID=231438 RepID=A0A4U8YSL7_9BACT|nr:DUF6765 family protein [Desulfoluna butyratoxydans]VFQ46507.1 hypothetical protein MSL71_41740 [Desulfoluna butyratoxydans]
MKIDAHYYGILAFCRACGFTKEAAGTIAYASQYVDDAKINHMVLAKKPTDVEPETIDGKPAFFNMATCHSYARLATYNYDSMTGNTCAFHFVPGCDGKSFTRKLRCKENSPIIRPILEKAKEENDLVKLGMVLHAYADTFSHQGFSGLLSKVNSIENLSATTKMPLVPVHVFKKWVMQLQKSKLGDTFDRALHAMAPAYGHGRALSCPDEPHLTWTYHYDYSDNFSSQFKQSKAINPDRFERAFTKIHGHLTDYLEKHPEYKDPGVGLTDLTPLFDTLLGVHTDKKRVKNWQKTMVRLNLLDASDPMLSYDRFRWLKASFSNFSVKAYDKRKVEGAIPAPDFAEGNWYRFYKAVHWYKDHFFRLAEKEGVTIPR